MTHSVLTHFGACDGRFSDEQVFEVLREGEAGGQSIANLCAAHGITLPMYCVWKAKYRTLSLDELRAVRRQADRRARLRLAGVVTVVMGLAAVGPTVLLVSGTTPQPAREARTLEQPPSPTSPRASVSAAPPASTQAAAPRAATAPAPVASAPPPATGGAYAVQVAAAQSPADAEALVTKLAETGHRAYVLPVTVGAVEHFRVRVGPFDSQPAADERARSLARNGFPGAWVVR